MTEIIIAGLLITFLFYIAIGVFLGIRTKSVADMLPISAKTMAQVKSSGEFSASTVATTISLATVILAFFELAEYFGLWLFWTVITTSAGLLLVRIFARRIWAMISTYDHRPTLNEFLGTEFDSKTVCFVGAICTSLGFLSAFALELIVGSAFFAGLVPNVKPLSVLVILSLAVFIYTTTGGFRAVIVNDRIQMISIWLMLLVLPSFYIYYIIMNGGWAKGIENVPQGVLSLSGREGLIAFLAGIFVINVPTYLSDMSIWQRIAGTHKEQTVLKGLLRSAFSAAVSWTLIILLACFAFMIIRKDDHTNPLILLIREIGKGNGLFAGVVLFFVVVGLYGAMLSTASTLLIAVSHTLYEDVLSKIRKRSLEERIVLKKELNISRVILIFSAIVSTAAVYILWQKGFTIADLVFAIYGAQLGLCPLVLAALLLKRERLKKLSRWAVAAISAGFITGWGTAIYGNFAAKINFVYLPPVISLVISSLIILIGLIVTSGKPEKTENGSTRLRQAHHGERGG
jgi:Na+/proline symporter